MVKGNGSQFVIRDENGFQQTQNIFMNKSIKQSLIIERFKRDLNPEKVYLHQNIDNTGVNKFELRLICIGSGLLICAKTQNFSLG